MIRRPVRLAPALLALALVPGCGGSSDNEPTFTTFNVFLAAQGNFEGTLGSGGSIAENAAGLEVGDRDGITPPGPVRAFVSFDLSTIPANATITFAQLRLDMRSVTGTPFTSLGDLMVDHVNYGAQFPPASAYNGPTNTIFGNIATLATDPSLGLKTASCTFFVNTDRGAGRTRSQFRLHFKDADSDNNGSPTFVRFQDAEQAGGGGSVPILAITYDLPN